MELELDRSYVRKRASESLHRRLTAEPKNDKEGRKRTKCYKWVGAVEDEGVGKMFLPSVYFPSFLLQAFLMFVVGGGLKAGGDTYLGVNPRC